MMRKRNIIKNLGKGLKAVTSLTYQALKEGKLKVNVKKNGVEFIIVKEF